MAISVSISEWYLFDSYWSSRFDQKHVLLNQGGAKETVWSKGERLKFNTGRN